MDRRDSQIDPFNAGEPELPWDAPEAIAEPSDDQDEASRQADGYESPVKQPDAYDAPDKRDEDASAKPRNRRPSRPARTADGKDSAARRRKFGCGTAILIFIIIDVVAALIGSIPMCASGVFTELIDGGAPEEWNSEFIDYDDYDADELDEGQIEVEQQTRAELDGLGAADSRARAQIVERFSATVQEYLGYTPEALGIDANAYADWALADLSYTIESVYAFEATGDGPDEGSAFFDVDHRDVTAFDNEFYTRAFEYLTAQGLTDSAVVLPSDAQRAELQALFAEVLGTHQDSRATSEMAMFDFTRTEDRWQVTDESYRRAVEYLFSLY